MAKKNIYSKVSQLCKELTQERLYDISIMLVNISLHEEINLEKLTIQEKAIIEYYKKLTKLENKKYFLDQLKSELQDYKENLEHLDLERDNLTITKETLANFHLKKSEISSIIERFKDDYSIRKLFFMINSIILNYKYETIDSNTLYVLSLFKKASKENKILLINFLYFHLIVSNNNLSEEQKEELSKIVYATLANMYEQSIQDYFNYVKENFDTTINNHFFKEIYKSTASAVKNIKKDNLNS